ncbi:(2Fe-2S)-binding protein [Tropicimonas sp. IMCC34011]|uniref:(2Fe-2S)-binding protein n=1 Tax=Tropicimonas sp. IMCC34011 TaxID=2248759 RepID=UPI000E288E55|nr:(2Fe-2S)-binding protein [Tropicimonas sp. IMCC34011]
MMAKKVLHSLTLNGEEVQVASAAGATLLETLREDLRILSSKRGCNQGVCGACTVLVDGKPVRSCLTLTARCVGHSVQTMEGMDGDQIMATLQRHMVESGGVQCGFCTGGVLISARELLEDNPSPTREAVKTALSGNICRCTGYRTIVDAVCGAAEELSQ